MKNFNSAVAENSKDEWLTPPEIIRSLGTFDLDPCAPVWRPWSMARQHYTILDDGLNKPWHGRVFCNPPYGRETFRWLDKLSEHGDGVGLVFARTETQGFHRIVWEQADAVFFFEGRLNFHHVDGTRGGAANAPSCLVAYGANNVLSIVKAVRGGTLRGSLVTLWNSWWDLGDRDKGKET